MSIDPYLMHFTYSPDPLTVASLVVIGFIAGIIVTLFTRGIEK